MAGTFDTYRIDAYTDFTESVVAENSLVVEAGDAVRVDPATGFVALSWVGERIDWISQTLKTFTATNETVEKQSVLFRPNMANDTYKVEVSGGLLTQANIYQYFQLTAGQLVDFATASATTGVVQLVEILGDGSFGVFRVTKQGL